MTASVVDHGRCLPDDVAGHEAVPGDSEWFDVTQRLGRRGYRQLPLPAQLTLAAARALAAPSDGCSSDLHGVWLGSSSAAARCVGDLDRLILAEGTGAILPTGAPYFSVNLVPSRAVRELGATGPCVTLTSTSSAGLDAIVCAARAVRLGQVEDATVVVVEVPDGESDRDVECGAVSLRLRPGGGAALRGASAFVAGRALDAARRVLAQLHVPATTPVVVSAEPARPEGEVARLLDRPDQLVERVGGPLTATVRLITAVERGSDLSVVVADPAGGATGVVLEHREGAS